MEAAEENSLWSSVMEKLFIDIMVDQATRGNMKNGVFHNRVWATILQELNTKSGKTYSIKQVKQKFNRLRIKHRAFSDLLNTTGFGWDSITNTVTADEEVWATYCKAHPVAHQFKKKGCENYRSLGILFNTGTATGVLHHASTLSPPNTDEENELDAHYRTAGVHVDTGDDLEADSFDDDMMDPKTRSGKRLAAPVKKVSKKGSRQSDVSEAIHAFVKVQNAKAERLKTSSTCEATSAATEDSLTRAMDILNKMPFAVDVRVRAIPMFTNADYRKMFLAMTDEMRAGWLLSL